MSSIQFSIFKDKLDPTLLITHTNDECIFFHEIYGHLNFIYVQNLQNRGR